MIEFYYSFYLSDSSVLGAVQTYNGRSQRFQAVKFSSDTHGALAENIAEGNCILKTLVY